MFAVRSRNRSRRSSRFVPGVDDLGHRIAPVIIIPVECGLDVPHPESIEQEQGPEAEKTMQQQMADLITRIEEMCVSTPADV